MKNLVHKIGYLLQGITGRLNQDLQCPSCDATNARRVDRKYFHSFHECLVCFLTFRYPGESAQKMAAFYQDSYIEPGITTELPDDQSLQEMVANSFVGTEKDFSYHINILTQLGAKAGDRILDFGANWGYLSWQLQRRGFKVSAYEISKPRAAYGKKLGIEIQTDLAQLEPGFDVIYSCHVLEHTPNPAQAIRTLLQLLKPGGLLVAHTPNASAAYRSSGSEFSRSWGHVHPVLLTDQFVRRIAGDYPFFVSSKDHGSALESWDQTTQRLELCDGPGLFFAIRKSNPSAERPLRPFGNA
jgi:2-polyprenyl-3-methyl-5-hydroxy-6-metoxy-1,4-benzoquinol methylase